jgi:RNA polymerase sigma factor (sigma-70 family)
LSDKKLNIASSDEELISSFLNGDKTAFNFIVRKYQKKVYIIIRKMVLDHDDADDITQEVFLKIYRSLGDFRGDSKFFTYIYKIAVNFSLNHLNRNKKILSRKSDIDNAFISSDDKIADELMISKDRTRLIEEAIETLPAQQRAVFNMRYYDNLSYEDISNILNKSVGGMKANYFHAIKRLEKFLKCHKKSELTETN